MRVIFKDQDVIGVGILVRREFIGEEASWLLGELTQSQMQPDTISYNAAISVCERSGEQRGAGLLVVG